MNNQNDNHLEAIVIGCLIVDSKLMDYCQGLKDSDFTDYRKGLIYKAMQELYEKDKSYDASLLLDYLKSTGSDKTIGGVETLERYVTAIPMDRGPENFCQYVSNIKNKSLKRQLAVLFQTMNNSCNNTATDVKSIISEIQKKVFELSSQYELNSAKADSVDSVVKNALSGIAKRRDEGGRIIGVPTGFHKLDKMLWGMNPSEFLVLAARPSMGKTALALNIAQYAALTNKKKVLIFSLEMSAEQLVERMLASLTMIKSHSIKTGKLDETEMQGIYITGEELSNSPIKIVDKASITTEEIANIVRFEAANGGVDLVMIDYLQLITPVKAGNRTEEVTVISRELKAIARENNVPVLCLSQLNRSVESKSEKRPQLSDIRDSGAIEQDADVVMFIYRDGYYNKTTDNDIAEIIVAKNRNGPVGTVEVGWLPAYTSFEDLENDDEEQ